MTWILMRKEFGGFRPENADGAKYTDAIRANTLVSVDVRDPRKRSTKQNNLFHAIIGKVWENQNRWPSEELLRKALTIQLGYAEPQLLLDGTIQLHAKSIAFHNMEQAVFSALMQDTTRLLCTEVIPGMDAGALLAEVEDMVA